VAVRPNISTQQNRRSVGLPSEPPVECRSRIDQPRLRPSSELCLIFGDRIAQLSPRRSVVGLLLLLEGVVPVAGSLSATGAPGVFMLMDFVSAEGSVNCDVG
jgi:hypothetical protein